MSGRIVGEVLDCAPVDLTQLERLVLVALAESARDATRIATHKTTRDALADRCTTTPKVIQKVLRELRNRGLIVPQIPDDQIHRGVAQHYLINKLTPAHRRATKGNP